MSYRIASRIMSMSRMKIDKAIGCLNERKLTTVVDFDNKSNNAFLPSLELVAFLLPRH